MLKQISIRIIKGSQELVDFTEDAHNLISQESERGNMLAKDADAIKSEIIAGRSCLAFSEEELVGYVAIFPWHYHTLVEICSLVAKEGYRRQGVGTMLVERAYNLTKMDYPESRIMALANNKSRDIFSRYGLVYLPKCCLPKQLWDVCLQCKDYCNLPACHCRGMIEQHWDGEYQLRSLTSKNEYTSGTAEVYCEVWKEHPWNEDFWTATEVMLDIEKELSKQDACGYIVLNKSEVVSFSWGYGVSKDGLVKISGSNKLDRLFTDDKKVFYLDELGTSSNHRRHKLGEIVSWQVLASAEEKGFNLVILRTDAKAEAAQGLYKKLGFEELPTFDEAHRSRNYWVLNLKPKIG